MAATLLLFHSSLMDRLAQETGSHPDGANGVLIVDVKMNTVERQPEVAAKEVVMTAEGFAHWARMALTQKTDAAGRRIVTVNGMQLIDDGENLMPANRVPGSAHGRGTDYGA